MRPHFQCLINIKWILTRVLNPSISWSIILSLYKYFSYRFFMFHYWAAFTFLHHKFVKAVYFVSLSSSWCTPSFLSTWYPTVAYLAHLSDGWCPIKIAMNWVCWLAGRPRKSNRVLDRKMVFYIYWNYRNKREIKPSIQILLQFYSTNGKWINFKYQVVKLRKGEAGKYFLKKKGNLIGYWVM